MFSSRLLPSLVLGLAFALPAAAQPGGDHAGHDHAGHDHAGHDHGAHEATPADARGPLLGDWRVDVAATLEADPEMKKAATGAGKLAEAERVLGQTRLRFTPDGRTTAMFPEGRREGIFTATVSQGALMIRIVDAHDNRLNTAEYQAKLADGRLTMTHEGATLVFGRPGAGPERPALPRARAKPIIGRWKVDVERTLAGDPRLKTMTAEQQKATRDQAQMFLGQVIFEWQADGTASITMGGKSQRNTWTLVGEQGGRYTLAVKFPEAGPAGTGETIELQIDGAYMRMTMGPQVLVLVRDA